MTEDIDKFIFDAAFRRICFVYKMSPENLRLDDVFGVDLKASFISDFRRNEPSVILDDIYDVVNKKIRKEILKKDFVINTVKDYCLYMVRCYKINPEEVAYVLGLLK